MNYLVEVFHDAVIGEVSIVVEDDGWGATAAG
jgi:hypothetical protein